MTTALKNILSKIDRLSAQEQNAIASLLNKELEMGLSLLMEQTDRTKKSHVPLS